MYSFPPRKIPPLEGQWALTKVKANLGKKSAPVAQGIEHRPPEAGAQVRILPGAQSGSEITLRCKYLESEINHAQEGNLLLYILVNVTKSREN